MLFLNPKIDQISNDCIKHPLLEEKGITLYLKREDQIHTEVSGNKFRKLKYNLIEAKKKQQQILTFGGAYSNHIAATAAAAQKLHIESIGVIRGEELKNDIEKTLSQNATLRFAKSCGMKFEFISREAYRAKESTTLIEKLKAKFGDFYLIPEGGTSPLAIKGCEEILTDNDQQFDVICCAVGTGGTLSGLINASEVKQQLFGFSALKGDFLQDEIKKYTTKNNWKLMNEYHFGGYAKVSRDLIEFINDFKKQQNIQLDPIYTGKMMYGIFEMIKNGDFIKNTRILAIHTGGLQGIAGMNPVLKRKKLPLIEI